MDNLRTSEVEFSKKIDHGPLVNESIHITNALTSERLNYDKDQITKFGKIHESTILQMLITNDSRYLFTLDYKENLKQFDVLEQY